MTRFCRLQAADAEAVFEILRPIYSQPQFPLGGSWNLRLIEQELDNGHGLGLFEQRQLIAFILFRILAGAWDVVILGTHPDWQRQGQMEKLIQYWVASKPAEFEVWLEVHENNLAAQNLYKKLGFRQVGRRTRYYPDGSSAILYNFR